MWNDGFCMSSRKSQERCDREVHKTYDFCKYHYHKHTYNKKILSLKKDNNISIKIICENYVNMFILDRVINQFNDQHKKVINSLNDNYIQGLLGIYDNWNEIPIMFWFKIDNIWWDIRILNNIFATGINQSEMECPYPVYPCNPYTRSLILPKELKLFRDRCTILNIKINNALNIFLKLPIKTLTLFYHTPPPQRTYDIVNTLTKKLRFRLINYKNSQDCYCGYWVPKKEKKSTFEQLYYVINNTSCYCSNEGTVIGDPNHLYALVLINELKKESCVLTQS